MLTTTIVEGLKLQLFKVMILSFLQKITLPRSFDDILHVHMSNVAPEILRLLARLAAILTHIRTLSRVLAMMNPQGTWVCKFFATSLTGIRLFARMCPHVKDKPIFRRQTLATH